MKNREIAFVLTATLALGACHKRPPPPPADAASVAQADAQAIAANANAKAAALARARSQPHQPAFDIGKAPLSTAPLGAFPYFSLPAGYKAASASTIDVTQFPIWMGDHFQMIDGKVYQASIEPAIGKTFSRFELLRNVESLMQQAGGVRVADSTIPAAAAAKLGQNVTQTFNIGLGDIYGDQVETFLIHRADANIWVYFSASAVNGSWAIVLAHPFKPTARLLPPNPAPTS